jgi:hypothetical protein
VRHDRGRCSWRNGTNRATYVGLALGLASGYITHLVGGSRETELKRSVPAENPTYSIPVLAPAVDDHKTIPSAVGQAAARLFVREVATPWNSSRCGAAGMIYQSDSRAMVVRDSDHAGQVENGLVGSVSVAFNPARALSGELIASGSRHAILGIPARCLAVLRCSGLMDGSLR